MKNLIKLEEAAMLGVCIYALVHFDVEWWWYLVMALGPDISMLGYLASNSVGAALYNLFHHKGFAIAVLVTGILFSIPLLQIVGVVLFGHSCLDRVFGYGLKLNEGFKYTHLGTIGKKD